MQKIPKGPLNPPNQPDPAPMKESSFGVSKSSARNENGDVHLWLDRIQVAKKYRDRCLDDLGVDRFVKEYLGEYDVKISGQVAPPIGEVYAYTQASMANLFNKDPYLTVNPQKKGTIKGAALLETAVNYYQRLLRTKDEFELELMDCILAGHAWHKTGISVKTIGIGVDTRIDSERFYSNRVSWRDVVFNIGCRRPPLDCRWIAQRIVKATDEVKEQYGVRSIGIHGGPHPDLTENELKTAAYKSDLNFSTLWEIHDIKTREVFLVCEGHDKFLKDPAPWPDYVAEFPFRRLYWNENPDSAFPIPDIKPFEAQIKEKIKFLGMAINHLKRNSRQLLIKKGSISQKEQDKLEKGIDGSFIEVKTNGNPAEAAQPLAYAPMPPEIFNVLNRLDEIINNVSGQPATDRGAPQRTISRTEDELMMIKEGSKSRTTRKLNRFEDHIESTAKDLIAHMQANFDVQQMIKITGEAPEDIIKAFGQNYDPQTKSIVFSKDDIQGEYDVDVQAGSTLPLDKETRMSLLSLILDKASRLAMLPSLPPFMQVVIKELLRDYNIKSLEEAFDLQTKQAEQSKQQQAQAAQADQQKTEAEASKRQAQTKEIQAETVLKTGQALHQAHQAGVLPEAIELGRGMGLFPDEQGNYVSPNGSPNGMQ